MARGDLPASSALETFPSRRRVNLLLRTSNMKTIVTRVGALICAGIVAFLAAAPFTITAQSPGAWTPLF